MPRPWCSHEGPRRRQPVLGGRRGRRARRRRQELGVDLVVVAPPQESDIQGQIALVEDQLAKNIDGIAIAPTDPNALAPIVEEARKQGVGVVFIDTKGINDGVTFIGTNNEVGAALAADYICKNVDEGQRRRHPAGHHHPVDRPGARQGRQEGPHRLRPERRRRAARRLGYRQGADRHGEHPDRQSRTSRRSSPRTTTWRSARCRRSKSAGMPGQDHRRRLRRQPQRRRGSPRRRHGRLGRAEPARTWARSASRTR